MTIEIYRSHGRAVAQLEIVQLGAGFLMSAKVEHKESDVLGSTRISPGKSFHSFHLKVEICLKDDLAMKHNSDRQDMMIGKGETNLKGGYNWRNHCP